MTRIAPLNLVDELIVAMDSPESPWTVHCEVRVAGSLDAVRVAEAAQVAAQRHPLARARLLPARWHDRRYGWEILAHAPAIPLEVVECPTEDDVARVRSALLSRVLALRSGPPFALALAHRPGGDSLILSLHHVAGDGMSAHRLMISIARAYAGVGDPLPDHDPLDVRDLRAHAASRSLGDLRARAKGLRERVAQSRQLGAPARAAVAGGIASTPGYDVVLVHLDRSETSRVMAQRRRPATVNDLLLGSLAIAIRRFNDARGMAPRRVSVMMPVSLRPSEWSQETVSNIVSFAPVTVFPDEQGSIDVAQRCVAERTRAIKDERRAGTMIDLLSLTGIWPVRPKTALLRRLLQTGFVQDRLDTAVLSNLGRLAEAPDFGGQAGRACELWFSPPGRMPIGTSVGVVTMLDELFLTLRYRRAQYDRDGATALALLWRDVLLGAPTPSPSRAGADDPTATST